MKNRTIIGIVCVVLAIAVMFGIAPIVNKASSGKTEIIQVTKRIEQGQLITSEDVIKVQIGNFGIKDTIIKDEAQIIGKYAAGTLMPDNCIYPEMLTEYSESADSVFRWLDGTQQAISITIPNLANGLSGKLQNGDIVSVVVVADDKSFIPAELTYVKIITTTTSKGTDSDQLTANEDGTSDIPATATLLVTPAQAMMLALHDQKAKIYLTLVYRGDSKTAGKFLDAQKEILENNHEDKNKEGDEHE